MGEEFFLNSPIKIIGKVEQLKRRMQVMKNTLGNTIPCGEIFKIKANKTSEEENRP